MCWPLFSKRVVVSGFLTRLLSCSEVITSAFNIDTSLCSQFLYVFVRQLSQLNASSEFSFFIRFVIHKPPRMSRVSFFLFLCLYVIRNNYDNTYMTMVAFKRNLPLLRRRILRSLIILSHFSNYLLITQLVFCENIN
jgi:hypothetical protein